MKIIALILVTYLAARWQAKLKVSADVGLSEKEQ